jgi:hypothetical protein
MAVRDRAWSYALLLLLPCLVCPDQPGRREMVRLIRGLALSCCSGDERCDDVRGVPVEAGAGPVISHGGARVGVRGSFLYIP